MSYQAQLDQQGQTSSPKTSHAERAWAMGVDLGGTKVEVAQVDALGHLLQRVRRATDVKDGPEAIEAEILAAARELEASAGSPPAGVGVGVAGQIDASTGIVRFAPNLGWRDVPLQADLTRAWLALQHWLCGNRRYARELRNCLSSSGDGSLPSRT